MNKFRMVIVFFALIVGLYTLASAFAELNALGGAALPPEPKKTKTTAVATVPNWLETISSFRPDLESRHALIFALATIQSDGERSTIEQSAQDAQAMARVKQTLSVAPYNAELWLVLALLQARRDPRDPSLSEALKMTYFTAPNDAQLMPARLDTATRFDALADPDVKELARGDVRLMVTRQPQLRTAVISAYRGASSLGKAFLEEAVQSIDPSFLPILRG